jgi:hypothetical protein
MALPMVSGAERNACDDRYLSSHFLLLDLIAAASALDNTGVRAFVQFCRFADGEKRLCGALLEKKTAGTHDSSRSN